MLSLVLPAGIHNFIKRHLKTATTSVSFSHFIKMLCNRQLGLMSPELPRIMSSELKESMDTPVEDCSEELDW